MKKLYTLLAIFIFISTSLSATEAGKKKNLFEGFVITNTGDTLFGKIQFINPVYNELKVKFYNEKGKKTTYNPREVVEYAFRSLQLDRVTHLKVLKWVHYYRKRVNVSPLESNFKVKTLFLQRVTSGKINLYNYYTLSTIKINHRSYNHEYFVEQATPDGFDLTQVNKKNFKTYSKELLADNEKLAKKLGTRGYGYKHFAKVVRMHNRS